MTFLCLDGTLVPTNRIAARTKRGHDVWFSGKHRCHGGNVQVITDPSGFPLGVPPACGGGVSDARPGSFHDLAVARELVLPALYLYTALRPGRLPVLTDKGYTGAGIGVEVPVRRPSGNQVLDVDTRTRNRLIAGLRAPAEQANALLQRWRALEHVTLDPWRIGTIAAAALVLTSIERGRW